MAPKRLPWLIPELKVGIKLLDAQHQNQVQTRHICREDHRQGQQLTSQGSRRFLLGPSHGAFEKIVEVEAMKTSHKSGR